MKHVYFFGCSFTVGDELSDEEYLPWKFIENHTVDSYYEKRPRFFKSAEVWQEYVESNKQKAYPSLISSELFKTYNMSLCGKSLKHNIFDIINLVESKSEIDALYLQIPPPGREMFINKKAEVNSILFNIINKTDAGYPYMRIKLKTHNIRQPSLEDILDLLMLQEYLKNKNIYFKFLDFIKGLHVRIEDLEVLHNQTSIYLPIINAAKLIPKIEFNLELQHKELGGHLNSEGHKIVAERLINDLSEQLINKQNYDRKQSP